MADKFDVLNKLQIKNNVLLIGAPGTGKSRLMNEVAEEFMIARQPIVVPAHIPGAPIPIPDVLEAPILRNVPFSQMTNKKVYRTTFHQNTKYRDLLTGIIPAVGGTNVGYCVSQGILFRANEFAKQPDSAALVIIDEINRGPAVEAFGGSISALEPDKRLGDDGSFLASTQSFEIISPDDGTAIDYSFSRHLYILAAMNQADVSVAPLDVAFLRRWAPITLEPDYNILKTYFGIENTIALPVTPTNPSEVYYAAICALQRINEKIATGRGDEYRLGHGIFMGNQRQQTEDLDIVLDLCVNVWDTIFTHVEELFFGNAMAIAYVINATDARSPYSISEVTFADDIRAILRKPAISSANIYDTLISAGEINV